MPFSRRAFVVGAASVLLVPKAAGATPERLAAAVRGLTGGVAPRPGRITLDVPPLVENGNTVAVTVTVASPMTEADHVRRIALFNEKNPLPEVAEFRLSPRAGRAQVSTRIRLADTQRVLAVAEMSDGSFWQAEAEVIVTLAACVEG